MTQSDDNQTALIATMRNLTAEQAKLGAEQAKLCDTYQKMLVDQMEMFTIMRRFIGEQQGQNKYLNKIIEQHTDRIRVLEEHRVQVNERIPRVIIDGQEITKRLDSMDDDMKNLAKGQVKTDNRISWFMGIGTALVFIVPYAIQWFNK